MELQRDSGNQRKRKRKGLGMRSKEALYRKVRKVVGAREGNRRRQGGVGNLR